MSDDVQNAAAPGGSRGVVEAACRTVNETEMVPVRIPTLGNHRALSTTVLYRYLNGRCLYHLLTNFHRMQETQGGGMSRVATMHMELSMQV
jgi:hypothetical protein